MIKATTKLPSNNPPNSSKMSSNVASSPLSTNIVTVRSMNSLRAALPHYDKLGEPSKPLSIFQCLKAIVFASRLNVLLVFLPLGIIASEVNWSPVIVFVFNFIAIIPLAKLLGFATEDISLRLGENLGALLNASFGNAVELILALIALKEGKIDVVKASLLGSILSNLLLVLGCCFVLGGIKFSRQEFNMTAAQTSSSLLSLACLAMLIPAAFAASIGPEISDDSGIQHLSQGSAIVMLVVYVFYLVFQLKTHTHLYSTVPDEEEPVLPLWLGVATLLGITVGVAVCSEFLVGAIDPLAQSWNISQTFIGLILLPIVGNAAEHVTAVSVAMKNKMDLAIGVAVGSSTQIALLVTPLMVIVGWIIHQPMTLLFNIFETGVLFVSVLIVNYLIQDGESNWLEGVMLISTYTIVAIAVFYYPASI